MDGNYQYVNAVIRAYNVTTSALKQLNKMIIEQSKQQVKQADNTLSYVLYRQ